MNRITWQIDCTQNEFRQNDCEQNAHGKETWQINCTENDIKNMTANKITADSMTSDKITVGKWTVNQS